MEPALYGLFGTLAGGIITSVVTFLTNRHQLRLQQIELESKKYQVAHETRAKDREAKLSRYAVFLSANWRAERYLEEIIDLIERRRTGWIEDVNKRTASEDYQQLITMLNDSLGWISIICTKGSVEQAAHDVNDTFDQLMDKIDFAFSEGCAGKASDTSSAREYLNHLHVKLRHLSNELRADLG